MPMDSNVQTYVTQLSNGEANLTEAANFYQDIVGWLANFPVLTDISALVPVSATGKASLPSTAVDLIFAFDTNGNQMGELSIKEAQWLFPNWQAQSGIAAYNFVTEAVTKKLFQLVPYPTGSPNITAIFAETRTTL